VDNRGLSVDRTVDYERKNIENEKNFSG